MDVAVTFLVVVLECLGALHHQNDKEHLIYVSVRDAAFCSAAGRGILQEQHARCVKLHAREDEVLRRVLDLEICQTPVPEPGGNV